SAATFSRRHERLGPLIEGRDLLRRLDVQDAHGEELVPRIAVMAQGSVVDGEEGERLLVIYPHGMRVAFEEQPVLLLAGPVVLLASLASDPEGDLIRHRCHRAQSVCGAGMAGQPCLTAS